MNSRTLIRQPSAYIPIAMSMLALTIVMVHVARFGAAREADEGTSAHLFQLLLVGQLPIVAFFAIKRLSRAPKPALIVLACQACAGLAALAPVYFLGL